MSDYHILDGEAEARQYRVAFHIPIPDEDNAAGVNLRTAVSEFISDATSIVPGITGAEQTQLTNGELVEVIKTYTRPAGNTFVQDRAAIDALFGQLSTKVADEYRGILKYWGFSREVP